MLLRNIKLKLGREIFVIESSFSIAGTQGIRNQSETLEYREI